MLYQLEMEEMDLWQFWKAVLYQLEMKEMTCDHFGNLRFINCKWIWTPGMFSFLKVHGIHSATNVV